MLFITIHSLANTYKILKVHFNKTFWTLYSLYTLSCVSTYQHTAPAWLAACPCSPGPSWGWGSGAAPASPGHPVHGRSFL